MENEVKVCKNCGAVIEGDFFEYDGEIYCEDCRDELFEICEHCGEWVPNDDLREVVTRLWRRNSQMWCDSCVDEYAERCDDCGEWFSQDAYLLHEVDNGNMVCEECLDNNYWWCEECDTYHHNWEHCPNYEDRIKDYHWHHGDTPYFYGVGNQRNFGETMTIGIELEVDRNSTDMDNQRAFLDAIEKHAGSRLYFEHDGSLHNGFEIISEPHTPRSLINDIDWKAIFRAGIENGYSSHDIGTCGLHVHIGRNFFGSDSAARIRNISKMIYFYERWFPEVVNFSRRREDQISSWASRYGCTNIDDCVKVTKDDAWNGRYHVVNLCNRNTVEIRVMRGTLNYDTFVATIDFVTRIARNAKKISYKNIDSLAAWLDGMAPETLEYMHRRGCFGK